MPRFIIMCLMLCYVMPLHANNQPQIDSLNVLLNNEMPVAQRASVLTKLCSLNWESNAVVAIEYGTQAVNFALKNQLVDKLAKVYNYCGVAYDYAGDYKKSLECYSEALKFAKLYNDVEQLSEAYLNFGIIYKNYSSFDTAIAYFDSAELLFTKLGFVNKVSDCYNNKGIIAQQKGDYATAMSFYKKALNQTDTLHNTKYLANIYNNLGIVYSHLEAYDIAASYYFKSMQIYVSMNYTGMRLALAYSNIAIILSKQGNYNQASMYFLKAYNVYKRASLKPQMAISLYNIAENYLRLEKNDSAIYYYNESKIMAKQLNNKYLLSYIYVALGGVYQEMSEYAKAEHYITEGLKIFDEIDDENGQTLSNLLLAKLYLAQNKLSNCYSYLIKAQQLSAEHNFIEKQMNVNALFARYYQKINQSQKAYNCLENYINIKDSLFNDEKHKQIVQLQIVHEAEIKDNKIKILSIENKVQETELKNKKTLLFLFTAGFVIVLLLLFVITIQYRLKRQAYFDLVKKSKELVESEINLEDEVKNVTIQNDEQQRIINQLLKQIKQEKIYKNDNLTINYLAKKLETNSKYLSQTINSTYNMNFNNYINKFRVKEAQKLLADQDHNRFTIEAIASNVGFNNKATFNAAFKKQTGVTPSFYKKSLQEI